MTAPSIAAIQEAVSQHFGLPVSVMRSPNRERRYARPRQLAMVLCRDLTGKSLPEIGGQFGGRDHTTVIHAQKAVRSFVGENSVLRDADAVLRSMLGAGAVTLPEWKRRALAEHTICSALRGCIRCAEAM